MRVLHRQEELVVLPLSDLEPSTDVEKHAVHTCFISKHTFNARINSPSPFNFLHSRFKNTIFFPTIEGPTFSREKGGHCGYHDFLCPDPLLNRTPAQAHCLARLMKRPKAAHCIKTTQEPTRRGSPRTRLGSRVPSVGYLTAYGKIHKTYIIP